MTLRLALVIDGDPAGAKAALEETGRAIEAVGKKAEESGRKAAQSGKAFEWESAEEAAKRLGVSLEQAGKQAGATALDLRQAGRDSGAAAGGLAEFGAAADVAGGRLGSFRDVLIGLAGGLAGGAAMALFTEGLKLAVGAAAELGREILSNQPGIERALASHAELVGRIKGAWSEANGAASSYGVTSAAQLKFEARRNVARLDDAVSAGRSDLVGVGVFNELLQQDEGARLGPFREEVQSLLAELRRGEGDVIAFREAVAEIATGLPENSKFNKMAEVILSDTQAVAESAAELARARDLLKGLEGDADATATALGGNADKYGSLAQSAAGAEAAVSGSAEAIRRTGEEADAAAGKLGFFQRLLNALGGGSGISAATPQTAADAGFASGGYTGNGNPGAVAGVVHRGEYVFDAASTARIGAGTLEAMRRGALPGYAAGGLVGSAAKAAGPAGPVAGGNAVIVATNDLGILSGAARELVRTLMSTREEGDLLRNVLASVGGRLADLGGRLVEKGVMSLLGFAGGGYTGEGSAAAVAGVVHRGEYVFDAASTARIGPANLEAMRRGNLPGYAGGGMVGGSNGGGPNGSGSGGVLEIRTYFDQGDWKQEVRRISGDVAAKTVGAAAPDIVRGGAAAARDDYARNSWGRK